MDSMLELSQKLGYLKAGKTDMASSLDTIDHLRREANLHLDPHRKSAFGQFMTPASVAEFMASLFGARNLKSIRLLDPGAGVGSLPAAFVERFTSLRGAERIHVVAYEIDELLRGYLTGTLEKCRNVAQAHGIEFDSQVLAEDFIRAMCRPLLQESQPLFTHAVLNPPYKKIPNRSDHRLMLRQAGIETVNLYSAFVALTIDAVEDGGEIVAIIPRSFCNGPYYQSFRDSLLRKTAIQHIHLFQARNRAFQDDQVLQENVIIHLVRSSPQGNVKVSTSTDHHFVNYQCHVYGFEQIVKAHGSQRFIHVPSSPNQGGLIPSRTVQHSLEEIGVAISTGPVVDFRLKESLRAEPGPDTVPLLYPTHFVGQGIIWPRKTKKPNALARNAETKKWLYPNGFYTVVRRFTSKEEKKRIVASVVCPTDFDSDFIAFENHLNVFNIARAGLSEDLAHGLAAFLNSTIVDEQFRRFSGHTQVNATDLRSMMYPSFAALVSLGRWAKKLTRPSQEAIDRRVSSLL